MAKNAFEALLEQRQLHGYVSFFEVEYGGYTIYYAGAYFGLIYETAKGDVEEREFCWGSFEEMYDCYIEEVGKDWREVLEARRRIRSTCSFEPDSYPPGANDVAFTAIP